MEASDQTPQTEEEVQPDPVPVQGDFPPYVPPPPDPPHAKRYRVTGEAPVFDHRPGEEFNATLPFQQESDLTQYGQLTVIADPAPADDSADTDTADTDDMAEKEADKVAGEGDQPKPHRRRSHHAPASEDDKDKKE
jgi:hypothetical protein